MENEGETAKTERLVIASCKCQVPKTGKTHRKLTKKGDSGNGATGHRVL